MSQRATTSMTADAWSMSLDPLPPMPMPARRILPLAPWARVDGREVRVVDPAHFHAAPAGAKGLGLFCDVDLEPGDCWWPHDWSDPRFVSRVLSWPEYLLLSGEEKRTAEVYGYIDAATRS